MPPVKRRYILFRIDFIGIDDTIQQQQRPRPIIHEGDLIHSVRDMVQKLYGDYGLASILFNFHVKKFDLTTRTGVFAVKRESYKFLITSLPLIQTIKNYSIRFTILKISGTIRGTLRSLQGYHGRMIHNYKQMLAERKHNQQQQVQEIEKGYESIVDSLIERQN
ncbi:POP5 ribonuclease P/MRP subunit [Dermatophagoides pteronyssinus]|uniref:POP5 ribonuclease P/MRP subunit n=1 Tax=Dermatophagoides pteronyssinus TaxID=6956 RepID=UPI003F66BC36